MNTYRGLINLNIFQQQDLQQDSRMWKWTRRRGEEGSILKRIDSEELTNHVNCE
jgi:hypothetical protein